MQEFLHKRVVRVGVTALGLLPRAKPVVRAASTRPIFSGVSLQTEIHCPTFRQFGKAFPHPEHKLTRRLVI